MAFDRIFVDQTELDNAQGNNEFAIGEIYLVSDTMTVIFAIGSSETKPLYVEDQNVGRFGEMLVEGQVNSNSAFHVDGLKVVGNRESAVADPSGGSVVDSQARSALSGLLARVRNHGLIAT